MFGTDSIEMEYGKLKNTQENMNYVFQVAVAPELSQTRFLDRYCGCISGGQSAIFRSILVSVSRSIYENQHFLEATPELLFRMRMALSASNRYRITSFYFVYLQIDNF